MSDKKLLKKEERKRNDPKKEGIAEVVKQSDMPKRMAEMISMTMQSGGLPPQVLNKITDKHIDKVLEITEKTNSYVHKDNTSERKYRLYYAILAMGLLVFLILSLKNNNKELLIQILIILASIIGGFGAGYGYCKYRSH